MIRKWLPVAGLLGAAALALCGCRVEKQEPTTEQGREVQEVADEAEEALKRAGEATKKATGEAARAIERGAGAVADDIQDDKDAGPQSRPPTARPGETERPR